MNGFYRVIRAFVVGVSRILYRVRVDGLENIPETGGFILASNHRSVWDPIFLARGVRRRQMFFMAKRELMEIPIFGFILKKLGAYPVNRGRGDTSALDTAVQIVGEGKILTMFPEGTRSKDGQMLKPQSGLAVIAHAAKCDVLPASIYIVGKRRIFKKITVRFGSMIRYDEFGFSETLRSSERKNGTKMLMDRIGRQLEEGHL